MASTPRKASSQKDVARLLGIDQKTVSRVFASRGYVSPDMRDRVMKAAKKLGYRPNQGARSMRTGRFNSIVLLQSTYQLVSHLPPQMLSGIQDGLGDMHLTLARMQDEALVRENIVPKILRELNSDGVLVNYDTHIPLGMIKHIESQPLPVVWINSKQAHDCVYPNDEQGGHILVEYLAKLGHRRIAYADYHVKHSSFIHYSRVDRLNGYRRAMQSAGLAPMEFLASAPVKTSDLASYAENTLRGIEPPTALITYSPDDAAAYIRGAGELGLKTPNDLSVCTFDLQPTQLGLSITIAQNPMRDVGRSAAEMLLEKIKKPEIRHKPRVINFQILEGDSCRKIS